MKDKKVQNWLKSSYWKLVGSSVPQQIWIFVTEVVLLARCVLGGTFSVPVPDRLTSCLTSCLTSYWKRRQSNLAALPSFILPFTGHKSSSLGRLVSHPDPQHWIFPGSNLLLCKTRSENPTFFLFHIWENNVLIVSLSVFSLCHIWLICSFSPCILVKSA